jgi:hypothetical protein
MPRGGGVAFEYSGLTLGNAYGGTAAIAGGLMAVGATFRIRDITTDVSGMEGAARLSVVLGPNRLSICPGIGVGYQRDQWDAPDDISVTSHTFMLRAGVGIGYELPEFGGISVAPYAAAHYEFAGRAHQLDVTEGETPVTGDTLSHAQLEWGVAARYGMFFAAFAANHSSTHPARPYMERVLIGLAFGSRERASRKSSSTASRNVR